jgi:hypothetical protein
MKCRRDFDGKHNQDDNPKPPLEYNRHFAPKPIAHSFIAPDV